MIDSKSQESYLAGKLEMPLANGVLRQRDSPEPMVFKGPALLSQDEAGAMVLRFFAEDVPEGAMMQHMKTAFSHEPGVLVEEASYYDFSGVGPHGETWTSTGLDGEWSFRTSVYLKFRVRNMESVREPSTKVVRGYSSVRASMLGDFEFPWHELTKGDTGSLVDIFEHRAGRYHWKARKVDDSMSLEFIATDEADPEPAFRRLLIALGIVAGKSVVPVLTNIVDRNDVRTSRMHSPRRSRWKAKLLRPVAHDRPNAPGCHQFIQAFLEAPDRGEPGVDTSELIYGLWHRVLRAGEHDVANSALVLCVAIEALLDQSFTSEWDFDTEFAAEVSHAKELLDKGGFKERARRRMAASLENALQPNPKAILRRLMDQGFVGEVHIKAWERLRNKATHGQDLGEIGKLQETLDLHHQCLGLFFRLIFVLIGYRGPYVDYSLRRWPTRVFNAVP